MAKNMHKTGIEDIKKAKGKRKLTMLTCYDVSFSRILDDTGLDMLLVGDSLANVILGLQETRNVSVNEMLRHTEAVARAATKCFVVADMPYASYQVHPEKAVGYARKFLAAGADAVKIEWFSKHQGNDCLSIIKNLHKQNIPVMGHIGLTPQTAHLLGGYKVQGRDAQSAEDLLLQAKLLEDRGVFCIVLECIPYQLARRITKALKIPTIGIGAGKFCDGQVLVLYDMLGLFQMQKAKRFVKVYAYLHKYIDRAVKRYIEDVRSGKFPSHHESFCAKA